MKIKSIKEIENNDDIFNLHVENNHNYFANNILVSNCHSSNAKELTRILKTSKANFRLGVTGTLPSDKLNLLNVKSFIGPVVRDYPAAELAKDGYVANCKIKLLHLNYKDDYKHLEFKEFKEEIFKNQFRLNFLENLLKKINYTSLILVNRVEKEGEIIEEFLKDKIKNKKIIFLSGRNDIKEREIWRHYANENDDAIIIATYGIFKMGINIKSLKYLILGSSMSAEITVLQSIGRALRMHENKKDGAFIFDIIDNLSWTKKQSKNRKGYYLKEKFETNSFTFFEDEKYELKFL